MLYRSCLLLGSWNTAVSPEWQQDTFKYNFDHMYHNHIVPYFQTGQVGEFTKGFEFSHQGVRFQVVGVQPEDSYGVVGSETEIFYEGPEIERKVLERLQLLPFEQAGVDQHVVQSLRVVIACFTSKDAS